MSDEPRRSGRATKGQHNKLESPEPTTLKEKKKPTKRSKKALDTQTASEDGEEEEVIRCICGNDDPEDKRVFVSCEICHVWQHNVCMGITTDKEELKDLSYYCEQCRPEEHTETLEALDKGVNIWETRNKLWQNEKKKSKGRKSKGEHNERPSWLKRELRETEEDSETKDEEKQEIGSKRKRSVKDEDEPADGSNVSPAPEKPTRAARTDKRRKAGATTADEDADTALVAIERLPTDRQKIARALNALLTDDIAGRSKSDYALPKDQTPQSLGEHYASRIEYALHINHGGPSSAGYTTQFRALHANLKKNKTLIQELLAKHLTPDELSTMSSSDMASEELQKERAAMKAESDRQAVIDVRDDGPRYRRTHKGDEIVENEGAAVSSAPVSRPVRESISEEVPAGSPVNKIAESPTQNIVDEDRRASNQAFDMQDIWAKTGSAPQRPSTVPTRRRSSIQPTPADGTKEDADVDRLLADDDDYAPKEIPNDIVWRGKLVQVVGDVEPTVNARWVAGRDVSQTIPWSDLLVDKLNIDGRLQIQKAEDYLCGLQWSSSSDVSVLALTPYDDAAAFDKVFTYFSSRARYAVVNKDKPAHLVKDLYIIPVDVGAKLPEHVEMLEHCTIKKPVEEKLLLATFVVSRAPAQSPVKDQSAGTPATNGHNQAHIRAQSMHAPAASPINAQGPQFGTTYNGSPQQQTPGYAVPPSAPLQSQGHPALPGVAPDTVHMAMSILGELAFCDTARQLLTTPGISADQMQNMRKIFNEDAVTRSDFNAFLAKLNM